jgi:hypothetical protein
LFCQNFYLSFQSFWEKWFSVQLWVNLTVRFRKWNVNTFFSNKLDKTSHCKLQVNLKLFLKSQSNLKEKQFLFYLM